MKSVLDEMLLEEFFQIIYPDRLGNKFPYT